MKLILSNPVYSYVFPARNVNSSSPVRSSCNFHFEIPELGLTSSYVSTPWIISQVPGSMSQTVITAVIFMRSKIYTIIAIRSIDDSGNIDPPFCIYQLYKKLCVQSRHLIWGAERVIPGLPQWSCNAHTTYQYVIASSNIPVRSCSSAGRGDSFVTRCCGRVPCTSAGMSSCL